MNESEPVARKRNNPSAPRGGSREKILRRTFDERLRAVTLHLQEGFTIRVIAQEMGVSQGAIDKWLQKYRQHGEEGLKDHRSGARRPQIPQPVRDKILELKKEDPTRGIKRISQLLKRVFFLKASSETVRQTLHKEELIQSPPKPRRNLVRPRFFERATPNQMWQSDIFTFKVAQRWVYLIGIMDDYSRFITGAGLFHSQTTENVLEVFRGSCGRLQAAPRNAHRQWPAVRHVAGQNPVPKGAAKGKHPSHPLHPASPDDAGENRALLGHAQSGVPEPGAI